MTTYKSTIREVRAVVIATTAYSSRDAARAFEAAKVAHAENLNRLQCWAGVEHIGPVIATGPEAHPFAQVLIGIACGAEIEWYSQAACKWHVLAHLTVLQLIGDDCVKPEQLRVKATP